MSVTIQDIDKILADARIPDKFRSTKNLDWLQTADSLKQAKGLAHAAWELEQAGMLEENRDKLYQNAIHAKKIYYACKWLAGAKLLNTLNFDILLQKLDHIGDIGRCLLELIHNNSMGPCRLSQARFLKIIELAQYSPGLGECFAYMSEANLLTNDYIDLIFNLAEYSGSIGEGLSNLDVDGLLDEKHFLLLTRHPQHAEQLSLLLGVFVDAKIYNEKITKFAVKNIDQVEVLIVLCQGFLKFGLLDKNFQNLIDSNSIDNLKSIMFKKILERIAPQYLEQFDTRMTDPVFQKTIFELIKKAFQQKSAIHHDRQKDLGDTASYDTPLMKPPVFVLPPRPSFRWQEFDAVRRAQARHGLPFLDQNNKPTKGYFAERFFLLLAQVIKAAVRKVFEILKFVILPFRLLFERLKMVTKLWKNDTDQTPAENNGHSTDFTARQFEDYKQKTDRTLKDIEAESPFCSATPSKSSTCSKAG